MNVVVAGRVTRGNRRLEVQAASHWHFCHGVLIFFYDGTQLPDALRVGAFRKPHKKLLPDAQNVAALNRAWKSHIV